MSRQHRLFFLLLAALLVAPPTAAQQLVGSGRALDGNLRLGSHGFNDVGRGAVEGRRIYESRYAVSNPQFLRQDYHNAFLTERYNLHPAQARYGAPPPQTGTVPQGDVVPGQAPTATAPSGEPLAQAGPTDMPGFPVLAEDQLRLVSYGVGFYLGQQIRKGLDLDGVDAELDYIIQGFTDGLRNNEPMIPEAELDDILEAVHKEMMARMVKRRLAEDSEFRKQYEANHAESRAFHESYGQREGVVTLPNGIQYKVILPGAGDSPQFTDTVVINVRVSLADGTEIANFRHTEVKVDETIEGGTELLPLMQLDAKWEAAIPPELAFGESGRSPKIGPNQTIIVEVELLSIK